ncbi:hypothetical protein FB45DRAFT_1093097 [Roridomyces roridus]|uniref:Uncharacterized protein n=1 Tax=Roridomyces roridus TaxID=1738132 RepID=A0AAD7FI00_9AGAR|nr:hypothetical protein FB45DRAFT_1093097 [Roridomyces roridus]
MEPVLPPELEKDIFKTTALLHPKMMLNLMLAAHRVRTWIEPLLYGVLTFSTDSSSSKDPVLAAVRSKTPAFLQANVRHIMLKWDPLRPDMPLDIGPVSFVHSEFPRILSTCNQVRSVALFDFAPNIIPALESARELRRLGVSLADLFYGVSFDVDNLLFGVASRELGAGHSRILRLDHPMFAHLTHLSVFDTESTLMVLQLHGFSRADFGLLPELTHLSLCESMPMVNFLPTSHHPINLMLTSCEKLEVLVILLSHVDGSSPLHMLYIDVADPRLVLMPTTNQEYEVDWECGARGGRDFWERAEMFVAKKRRGEIKPASRCYIETDDGI